jgi:TolB-like protein
MSNEKHFQHKEFSMKRKLFASLALLAALSIYGQSRDGTLDSAIRGAVRQIQDEIAKGQTIIVYQFDSPNQRLSDHILKELFNELVNSHRFIVLDRSAQEVIDAELDYQFNKSAGMISDDSLASLTKRIGAQAILTGSLDDAGGEYRFRARVIGTETTEAVVSFATNVDKGDKVVAAFEGRKSAGLKVLTGALNIALGLGSYLEGDIGGGATITAGYAIAVGLVAVEYFLLDWDNDLVGSAVTAGVAVAGLSLVYGFARPFIYNRAPRLAGVLDNAKAGLVMVSDSGGNRSAGFQAAYTIKF